MTPLVRALVTGLRARTDPAYLESLQRLVPGVSAIGVRVPAIRALVREVHGAHPDLEVEDVVPAMHAFARTRGREELLAGIFLLARFRRRLPELSWPDIERWIDAIDNWEVCDQLATNVVGEKLAGDPSRLDRLVAWARAPEQWRRRFALACTVALNQRGRRDPAAAERVLAQLGEEREPIVKKAMVWVRRELAKSQRN